MPFFGNKWEWNKVVPSDELKNNIENIYSLEKLIDEKNSTSKRYQVNGARGTLAFISTVSQPFCAGCNRLRLSADGKLRNCLFATRDVDLLNAVRNGNNVEELIVLNVKDKAFSQGGLNLQEKMNGNRMVHIGG